MEPSFGPELETVFNQMLEIPAGEIAMRDDRIKRQWTAVLRPFRLARYPVTQDLYFAVTRTEPFSFKGDRNPAENVSWNDAVRFCNQLSRNAGLRECYALGGGGEAVACDQHAEGFRLPTEAEWEYACRAGSAGARYGDLDRIAWYHENSGGATHAVGQKEPNAWGLYDMLGNVWEWCWDVYDAKVYGAYRVFRGGGWCDAERGILASNRRRSHPTFKIDDLGFRLAQNG